MSRCAYNATDLRHVETAIDDDVRRKRLMTERHHFMLVVSAVVIVLSFVLRIGDTGHVQSKLLPSIDFPVLCGSRALFGVECPGCGLTRSFVALAGGDVAQSLAFHRIGWVLALSVVAQIPFRLYLLHELRYRVPNRHWPTWYGRFLIALLIGNWLLNQVW